MSTKRFIYKCLVLRFIVKRKWVGEKYNLYEEELLSRETKNFPSSLYETYGTIGENLPVIYNKNILYAMGFVQEH